MPRLFLSSCLVALLLPGSALVTFAQDTSSVLDGVFTTAQAQRGARTYRNVCAHCHEGGEPDADPLFGAEFIERWREAPLSFLHGFFSTRMPADEPGTLSPATYVDTLAFLLSENGYPAGSSQLAADRLDGIVLTGMNGPAPLPPNSLVRLSGCLAPGGGSDEHALEQAAAPVRVRVADETTAEELALSAAAAPGTLSYRLRNAARFDADGKLGRKVQAKGVLSQGTPPSLNVLSLESTGQGCD